MNAGAVALRTFRGPMPRAALAERLALSPELYERIEAGEVIPEPWLRSAIAAATGGLVAPPLWGAALSELPVAFGFVGIPDVRGEARLGLHKRSDGWWLHVATLEAAMSMPIETGRALWRELAAVFGLLDGSAAGSG